MAQKSSPVINEDYGDSQSTKITGYRGRRVVPSVCRRVTRDGLNVVNLSAIY